MIEPVPMHSWLAFDARYPAPTFFARPAWAQALAYAYPHLRPYPVWVHTPTTSVLVPLMQSSGGRLGWREFVGMPLGTYTCAMRGDGTLADAAEYDAAISILAHACDALTIVPWPLATPPCAPSWTRVRHEAAAIDLSSGETAVMSRMAGVSRRMAGQAERRGIECAPCRSGLAVSTFYGMLCESSERWGLTRPPFPRELLDGLYSYGGSDVEIWLAQCDGHPVAGGVVVFGSQELFFWSAAMRQAFARLRPSNALNLSLIRAALARGVHWYNLGASEGLPGVERFKRGLGADAVTYAALQYKSARYTVYSHLRSSLRRMSARTAPAPTLSQGGS